MTYIISAETLHGWMGEKALVLIDVRAHLQDENFGKNAYEKGHLPGAHFLDLKEDLSGKVEKHGGNHPFPDFTQFARKLGDIGVDHEKTVVVYDDESNMFAPRAWFLLRHLGHRQVYVLNGGYKAWQAAGYEVTTDQAHAKATTFTPQVNDAEVVRVEEIKNRQEDVILIDARAQERYLGIEEPLYAKKGHIPGAINYFWGQAVDETGRWKDEESLREHFKALPKDKPIIMSCGSGVSACGNILALRSLGFDNVKLYPGGFSDWISYDENKVETKDESKLK